MTTEAQRVAIREMIERHTVAATADKQTARQTLIREGVYTTRGALKEAFGGRKTAAR
jgi:hypothetical protein